jgi:hypothetical protein
MKPSPTSKPPASAEQDYRTKVALEIAALHAEAATDSRLCSALQKLRQARDEITALKAEKRALAKKLAAHIKTQEERRKAALTDEEKQRRIYEIFGVAPEYRQTAAKACQEAQREPAGAQ